MRPDDFSGQPSAGEGATPVETNPNESLAMVLGAALDSDLMIAAAPERIEILRVGDTEHVFRVVDVEGEVTSVVLLTT